MTTTYPEGTRWAVRVGDQWEDRGSDPGCLGEKKDRWLSSPDSHGRSRCYELAAEHVRNSRHDVAVVRIPPPRPKRSVEKRIAAVAKAQAEWVASLAAERGSVEERITTAVRERTEVILKEWSAPSWMVRRGEGSFGEWLRDLLDGKVSA